MLTNMLRGIVLAGQHSALTIRHCGNRAKIDVLHKGATLVFTGMTHVTACARRLPTPKEG